MEIDKRTIQTQDIGLLAGILLRTSNTCELYANKVASLECLIVEKDKTIKELTEKCKRLIDEKNANVQTKPVEQPGGNGVAAS